MTKDQEPDPRIAPQTSCPEPDPVEPDVIEKLAAAIDDEENSRKWLRVIATLLEHRSDEPDPTERVQTALDNLMVAACERAGRLLRSDVCPDERS